MGKKRGSHCGSEKISLINSPFRQEPLYKPVHSSSQDLFDRRQISKESKKGNQSSVYVNSARTTHNSKSLSKPATNDSNLLKRDFNPEKFRAMFAKFEDKRKNNDISRHATENGCKPQTVPKSYISFPQKKKEQVRKKTTSKETNKSGKTGGKTSYRDKANNTRNDTGGSRSREIDSFRSSIPIAEFYVKNNGNHYPEHKDIGMTRKTYVRSSEELTNLQAVQNFVKTKTRELKFDEKSSLSQFEDIGFLFSKKLSNMEKMSLLKLRKSKKNPDSSIEDVPAGKQVEKMDNRKLAEFIKESRLKTRMSASDSDRSSRRQGGLNEIPSQRDSKASFESNRALEAELDAHCSTNYNNYMANKSSLEMNLKDPKPSSKGGQNIKSPHYSKKLFGRRKSFCEERPRGRFEKEVQCDLNQSEISMTSGISYGESGEETIGYQGGSDLHRSNSELLLRSMISSVGNTQTDTNSKMGQVEEERGKLMAYIRSYTEANGKIPKTSLQFYKIVRLVGKGSFGKVHMGIHLLTRRKVAIKCIDKEYILEEKAQNKVVQEVTLLKGMNHRNIVKILEVFENKKYVFIVTDFAERGDLLQYMKENGVFKENKSKPIISQILNGLEFCHLKGIMHRDVKLDNILLDQEMKVKICDFGVSRVMPKNGQPIKERCGTPAYIAPEIIKNQGYSGYLADVRLHKN